MLLLLLLLSVLLCVFADLFRKTTLKTTNDRIYMWKCFNLEFLNVSNFN